VFCYRLLQNGILHCISLSQSSEIVLQS